MRTWLLAGNYVQWTLSIGHGPCDNAQAIRHLPNPPRNFLRINFLHDDGFYFRGIVYGLSSIFNLLNL